MAKTVTGRKGDSREELSVFSRQLEPARAGVFGGVLETDRHRVDALQSDPQHVMHAAIGVGGFEKADTAVVSVAYQARKAFLPKLPLYPAAIRTGTEGQSRYLHVALAQRDPVGRQPPGGLGPADAGKRRRSQASRQKIASGSTGHASLLGATCSTPC